MAIRKTSDCNSCPDCVGCSLGKRRKAVFCDRRRQEISDNVFIVQEKQLCDECALASLESYDVEDILDDPT